MYFVVKVPLSCTQKRVPVHDMTPVSLHPLRDSRPVSLAGVKNGEQALPPVSTPWGSLPGGQCLPHGLQCVPGGSFPILRGGGIPR